MRNMEKAVENLGKEFLTNKTLYRYDMNDEDMTRLISMCREGQGIEAILTAFQYGFVLGHRATVAGKIKEKL